MARQRNVLIIEDDEGIRETLRMMLDFEGYTVFAAANGKEGMSVLKEMPKPCLILLDLILELLFLKKFQKNLCKN